MTSNLAALTPRGSKGAILDRTLQRESQRVETLVFRKDFSNQLHNKIQLDLGE
jgi:hypothetical protein